MPPRILARHGIKAPWQDSDDDIFLVAQVAVAAHGVEGFVGSDVHAVVLDLHCLAFAGVGEGVVLRAAVGRGPGGAADVAGCGCG